MTKREIAMIMIRQLNDGYWYVADNGHTVKGGNYDTVDWEFEVLPNCWRQVMAMPPHLLTLIDDAFYVATGIRRVTTGGD